MGNRDLWRAMRNRLRLFGSEASGNSLVEVGIVMCFFCTPLLVGTGEMGLLVFDSIQVQNSAHTGVAYGAQSTTYASDTSGMRSASQGDAPVFGSELTVTPTDYYVCSDSIGGTQYTGSNGFANATSACTGGTNHPLEFVQVTTSVAVTPGMHLPALGSVFNMNATSAMEVAQ